MFQTTIPKKAFSLIELSIVLIIIGLLMAGITAGSSLIKASKLSSAQSTTLASQIVTIPGMILWFESSTKNSFLPSQTTNGAQINAWYNLEPSNFLLKNNLTANPSNDVVYKETSINDLPAVNMTVNGKMSLDKFSGSALSQSTIIIVFKPTAIVDSNPLTIIDSGVSGSTSSISIKSDGVVLNAGNTIATPASFVQDNNYILMVNFNGKSSKVFVNNIVEVGGLGANLDPGTNAFYGLTIGANKNGANGIAANISEVIIYNRTLKDVERQDVMSYLMAKYKINVAGL